MAATLAQKTAAINLLKQKNDELAALGTAIDTVVTGLVPATSTADEIQAAVDAYNTARSTLGRVVYGNILLPVLASDDVFTQIKADADATP